jgi:putative ABC transport system permease protein
MEVLVQDIRYALRSLAKSPGFTVVAVLTLGLGIGAVTTMFSVVNGVVLKPLAYRQPDRLVEIQTRDTRTGETMDQFSFPNFRDVRSGVRTLTGLATFRYWLFNLSGETGPDAVLGVYAGDSLFATLGVQPLLGQVLSPGGDNASHPLEALLSYGLWTRRYAADRSIVGKAVTVDGKPTTVAGVLPAGFRFPELVPANTPLPSREPDIYLSIGNEADSHDARGNANYWVIGRLAPGATLARANQELQPVALRLQQDYPDNNARMGLDAVPLKDQVVGDAPRPLLVLLAAVGFVLLIACANVGGLLLARAAGREREIAVRTALGATPGRLARQVLTESAVLSLAGGSVGVALAAWGVESLRVVAPDTLPRLADITIDGRVLLFTLAISLVSGVLFGLWPVLRRADGMSDALREGGRHGWSTGRRRLRAGIVTAEVALSIVLLTGAGLLLRSFVRLAAVDPGFDATNVITMFGLLPPARYPDATSLARYQRRIVDRLQEIPGVSAAGTVNTLPLSNLGSNTSADAVEHPAVNMAEMPNVAYRLIGGSYFRAMGIPVVAGRDFGPGDTAGAPPVAIVNQAAAKRFFPGENPLGRHLRLMNGDMVPKTIVGVVRDTHGEALDVAATPEVSYPFAQGPEPILTLAIRTRGDPHRLLPAIHHALTAVDPQQPYYAVRTMDDLLAASLAQRRFDLDLLAGFAVVALLLAAIGLYGLIAYSVSQRTQEIGVRMALGADAPRVLGLVLRDGFALTAAGTGIGLLAAAWLTRFLQSQLFGVGTLDPVAYGLVVIVFALVAGLASYIPARRATRVDPVVALRTE